MHTDCKVGKRTLPVRFGLFFGRAEVVVLAIATYSFSVFWWRWGVYGAALLPLLTIPMAYKLVERVCRNPPSAKYNDFLAFAGKLHAAFGILLAAGIWVHDSPLHPV
ncbi:hypothetical protein CYMTET_30393 [Cymbomonas tetramitiformis]|uniref:1,4-dihydroxy-2-naphthoate octaprenyltransferase n=1 Tax=Cymbomonas tetramitiformis TaxID=36881 RepID=A0AAE0KU69_9CHLO|nr:hypothetical protein CYMTET_30393 [Cymbomonas tetramitiformis]